MFEVWDCQNGEEFTIFGVRTNDAGITEFLTNTGEADEGESNEWVWRPAAEFYAF